MTIIPRVKNTFWGNELPYISVFNENWVLVDEWRFTSLDNFRMEISAERVIDSRVETAEGKIRERLRGYRVYFDFKIENVHNREIMKFFANMWQAAHIVITPHDGSMLNPDDQTYNFEVLMNSDFNPKYFDGRFIGHSIEWQFQGLYLLSKIPIDVSMVNIIPADTTRSGGVTSADQRVSMTFWGEKLFYGGWELTTDDFNTVAFFEPAPEGEEEPYGVW